MIDPIVGGIIVIGVLVLLHKKPEGEDIEVSGNHNRIGDFSPVPLSRLTPSGTAQKYGVSNAIPDSLLVRARGMRVIVGLLEGHGFRVTSVYRSPVVSALVSYDNEHPDGPPADPATISPDDDPHTQLRATDIGADGGPSTDSAAIQATIDRLKSIPELSVHISSHFKEGNHDHVQWKIASLETLGRETLV